MSSRAVSLFLHACAASCALLLVACGGGSNAGGAVSGGGPPSVTTPPPPPPPPPPPNHAPELGEVNLPQSAVYKHAFNYDLTNGGRAFADPDGDTLRYDIKLGHDNNWDADPDPPHGWRVEGTQLTGAPEEVGTTVVTVTVTDPGGLTAFARFTITVDANKAPSAAAPLEDRIVNVGELVDMDASMNGAAFADPEGDAMTYEIALRGAAGLSANGSHLQGHLDSVGAVEVTVTARDPFGGEGATTFLVAAPAAAPGAPTFPATAYIYKDEELPLPAQFRMSSERKLPLWDTQVPENRTTNEGAALGRILFHDKRLSITNTVACATCHQRTHGFASPERFNTGALGIPLKRNSMALANARYNLTRSWFLDMRVNSIQDVARQAIQTPDEMGNRLSAVVNKLSATPFYLPLFESAFGTPGITGERVLRALEQYVQALLSYTSRFDEACGQMDITVIPDCAVVFDAREMRGLEIFTGAGGIQCNRCHELPAATNVWQANNGLDAQPTDLGIRSVWLRRNGQDGMFRPAALRNIALSAPYMHDGRFSTLREVIDHYDHDIKASPDLDSLLRDTNNNPLRMNLSEADKDALESFLRTLTDEEMLADPKFSDPFQ